MGASVDSVSTERVAAAEALMTFRGLVPDFPRLTEAGRAAWLAAVDQLEASPWLAARDRRIKAETLRVAAALGQCAFANNRHETRFRGCAFIEADWLEARANEMEAVHE